MATWRPSASSTSMMSRRSMGSAREFSSRPAMAGHPGSSATLRGGQAPRGSIRPSKR
jgi:hypothetical protein